MFKLTGIGHLNGRVPLLRQGENLASNLEITLPIDYQGYTYNVITKVNTDPPIYSPQRLDRQFLNGQLMLTNHL